MSRTTTPPALTPARIIDTAIALADRIGLADMSMRRLGDELGVSAMALYRHTGNREELITAMVDAAIQPATTPDSPAAPTAASTTPAWREQMRTRILATRARILRHPWLTDAIREQTSASPVVMAYMNDLIGILIDGGVPIDIVHNGMHALSTRMWGFTIEVFPTPTLPTEQPALDQALATYAVDYPAMIAMSADVHRSGGCDADAEFSFALDIILDGIERAANR